MLVEDDQITFRAVLIGDSSVGKTSVVNRFIHDRFNPAEPNTIGALYGTYSQERQGQKIEIQVWDTAGTEQYQSLTPVYFRSAAAALVVFDVTKRPTFLNLDRWVRTFRGVASEKAIMLIIGNKLDLSDFRCVERSEAEDWAREQNSRYFETSAKTGDGISDVFSGLIDVLFEQSCQEVSSTGTGAFPEAPGRPPEETKRCC
jgi:small GTP-binding protein